jgi:hypothetical protein
MTPDDLRQRLSDEVLKEIYVQWSWAITKFEAGPRSPDSTWEQVRNQAANVARDLILAALAAPAPVRTCAGCRHWDRYDGDEPEPENQHNECRAANRPADYMLTGADFGCSLWQPTPQEEA